MPSLGESMNKEMERVVREEYLTPEELRLLHAILKRKTDYVERGVTLLFVE
jgi:hypothetical protein